MHAANRSELKRKIDETICIEAVCDDNRQTDLIAERAAAAVVNYNSEFCCVTGS